jgi:hypothetical protein
VKLISFFITKEMVSKLKKSPTELEKIFASYSSDSEGSDNQYIQGAHKLNSLKISDPMKQWANELKRAFSKEEVQMSEKYMKKCSSSLAIKEIQINTTLRFHLTPVRIVTIKKTKPTNVCEGMGKRNPHTLLMEM